MFAPTDIATSLNWSFKANCIVNGTFIGPLFTQGTLTPACWNLKDTQSKQVCVRGALIKIASVCLVKCSFPRKTEMVYRLTKRAGMLLRNDSSASPIAKLSRDTLVKALTSAL